LTCNGHKKKRKKGKTSSNGGLRLALAYMQTTKPAFVF